MALPVPVLTWPSLTGVVNLIKSPGKFTNNLLKVREQTLPTETIEVGTYRGERDVAPFIRKGSEAVLVGGLGSEMFVVEAPNIRIKRPFNASTLFQRQPGTTAFPTGDQVVSAMEERIARDMQYMNDLIENAEEWMTAMSLQGGLSYSTDDQEVFTITYARSANNSITPSIFWDQVNATPEADLRAILQIVSEAVGLGVTDAIMGSEAAAIFGSNTFAGATIRAAINLQANLNAGQQDLAQRYRDDGALYMGNFMGINFWSYPRTLRIKGVATPLIRAKYIEFVSATRAAQHVRYYGAIPDMDALRGRNIEVKKFAKSWTQPDPSAMMALIHSRPLAVPRIIDSTVSFKAISG